MKKIVNLKPLIKVVISKQNFPNLTKEYNALIDTGAVKTFISNKVKNEIELDVVGNGSMNDAGNKTSNTELVYCNLLLEDHLSSAYIEVAIFQGRPECDIIIGMDLISYGVLLIDNDNFSFEVKQLM